MRGGKLIFAISDLQVPFEHQDALAFVQHVVEKYKSRVSPKFVEIINMGDEVDQCTLGKYGANPNNLSAGEEIEIAIEHLKPWFKAFPKTKVCISNHTWRAYKRAFEIGLPDHFLKSVAEVYKAPQGWQWAQRWIVDNICFEHGEHVSGQTAALNAAIQNRMNTVIGHQHSHGGIIHSGSFHNNIWGMNTGCLIDINKYAFNYAQALRKKPTLGMGVIWISGGESVPFFEPMILDKRLRWRGF